MRRNANPSSSRLVMNIMEDLRDTSGVSLSEIIRYASVKYGIKEEACKVPMKLALKRGVKNNTVKVRKGSKKPVYVFNLPQTSRHGNRLKYVDGYLGKKSARKSCSSRIAQKKAKMTMKVTKGRDKDDGKKRSRCKWCKKLIRDKRKRRKSTITMRKVVKRPKKNS